MDKELFPAVFVFGLYSLNQLFKNWLQANVMLLCASYTEAPDASGK